MISLEDAKSVADIFQSVCIGLGALFGGIGALRVLSEWRDQRRLKRETKKWKRKFPKEKLNKDFRLLRISYSKDSEDKDVLVIGHSDKVYICDVRTKTRHWVADQETLTILGFNQEEVHGVAAKELETYASGKTISLSD